MQAKLVSIIIPTYNSSRELNRTLSLIHNSEKYNVIIIDDGSCELDAKQNKKISQKYSCQYEYIKNSGPSHARYIGLTLSKTNYCMFLDSDDYISDVAIDTGVGILSKDEMIDAIVFKSIYVDNVDNNFTNSLEGVLVRKHKKNFYFDCIECLGYPKNKTIGWNQSNTLYRREKILNLYKVRTLSWAEDIPLKLSLISSINFASVDVPGLSKIKISYGRGYLYNLRQVYNLCLEVFSDKKNFKSAILAMLLFIRYVSSFLYKKIKVKK